MLAAVAVANIEAMVDKAVVLEDEDSDMDKGEDSGMDVDAADSTSHTRHDVPIAVWTITPPRNAERHLNRLKPASQGQYRKPNNDNANASIAVASLDDKPYAFG